MKMKYTNDFILALLISVILIIAMVFIYDEPEKITLEPDEILVSQVFVSGDVINMSSFRYPVKRFIDHGFPRLINNDMNETALHILNVLMNENSYVVPEGFVLEMEYIIDKDSTCILWNDEVKNKYNFTCPYIENLTVSFSVPGNCRLDAPNVDWKWTSNETMDIVLNGSNIYCGFEECVEYEPIITWSNTSISNDTMLIDVV